MKHNFNDKKYDRYKEQIEEFRNQTPEKPWDDIQNFVLAPGLYGEIQFNTFKYIKNLTGENDIPFDTWKDLVTQVKKESVPNRVIRLHPNSKSDAFLPKNPYSQWIQYRKKLVSKNFSHNSIKNIENDAFHLIQYLSDDTQKDSPVIGLAIGDVQSGKTANMAALISMAADNGFNFFIVLSGVIENLRKQTANRLYKDLDNNSSFTWTNIENPKLSSHKPESDWNNINLTDSNKKYYLVSLKNKSRLDSLIKWLYSDENKLKDLKMLIIDDEADQASINTNNLEDENPTTINKYILDLVYDYKGRKAKAVNYISYTATPYANVLNEFGPRTLYPKDFVYTLTPSEDYIGAKKMFGLEEPESAPELDIVRNIPNHDFEIIQQIHKGETFEIPTSLKKAVDWFIIVSAMQRHFEYSKPVSMLVHTSLKIDHHEVTAQAIHAYLNSVLEDRDSYFAKLEELYEHETTEFTLNDFKSGMLGYSNSSQIKDYPAWEDVLKKIKGIINSNKDHYVDHINLGDDGEFTYHKGIHLIIDNSRTKVENQQVRLVYPTNDLGFAPLFIVIGGNTLSRGLTLEGLVSSYFIRQTKQADTLYQMGRWFGYRMDYELLPRVWLDSDTKQRFEFVSQMNQELTEDIVILNNQLTPPSEVGVKIKNSPNYSFIKITANNKMQSAIESELDFTGFNKQTVLFKNEKEELESNITLTEQFLNTLSNLDTVSKKRMIWRDVEFNTVRDYLSKMFFSDRDIAFSNITAFLDWYESVLEDCDFENWNIVLVTKGNIPKHDGTSDNWNIHGYSPNSITRNRRGDVQRDQKTVSIGALRSPFDLISDVPNIDQLTDIPDKINRVTAHDYRQKHGLGNVPQLIIYRVDKDGTPIGNKRNSDKKPLDFDADIIGINLAIPGIRNSNNLGRTLTINIKEHDENDEMHEDDEE